MSRSRFLTRLVSLASLAVLLTATAPVRAQPSPAARIEFFNHHVERAAEHKAKGELEAALEAYGEALGVIRDLSGPDYDGGRARVRYQRARLLFDLDRLAEARIVFQLLVSGPGLAEPEREKVRERLAQTEARIAAEETVDASAEPEPGDEAPATPPQASEAESPTTEVVEPAATPSGAEPGTELLVPGLITGGAGLAVVVVGGVLHGLANADFDAAARAGITLDEKTDLDDAGSAKQSAAIAMYAVGGAAVVAGVVLMVLHDPAEPSDAPAVGAAPLPGGGAMLHALARF